MFIVKSTKQKRKIAIIIRMENCDHHNERTKESRLSNFIIFCKFFSSKFKEEGNVQLEWTIAMIFKIWTTNLTRTILCGWMNACLYTSTLATLTQIIIYIIFKNFFFQRKIFWWGKMENLFRALWNIPFSTWKLRATTKLILSSTPKCWTFVLL